MMIAVAVVGVIFGVVNQWRRRDYCLRRAAWHAAREANLRAEEWRLAQHTLLIAANLTQVNANKHARLKSIYQRIAWKPWEPLPDDPFLEEPLDDNAFFLNSP